MNAPPRTGLGAGRIAALVVGSLVLLVGAGLLLGGIALTVIDRTQRDSAGYFMTGVDRYATPTYALTTRELSISSDVPSWLVGSDRLGDVRVEVTPAGAQGQVFVGIAPRQEVDTWLAGVEHDVVTGIHGNPFRADYERQAGARAPGSPQAQTFWAETAVGAGTQRLTWTVRTGDWSVVVMNADGSRALAVDARVGANTILVLWLAIGMMVAGLLVLAAGTGLVILGAREPASRRPAWAPAPGAAGAAPQYAFAAPAPGAPAPYPVTLHGRLDNPSRGLWLVKWLLLIPHAIVLAFLWVAFVVLTAVALVAIVVTGRYPRGIFEFNTGVLRWTWRVVFYGYSALGTDRYPPFSLGEQPDYPATLEIPYPERLSRGLALVKWWLLAIPQYLVVAVIGGAFSTAAGLVGILVLVAAVVLLFTRQYPRDIFRLVLGLDRWSLRVLAYAALMRDEYPPFRLDMDDEQPQPSPRPQPLAPGGMPLGHGAA